MVSFYLSNLHTENDLKAIVVERWGYSPLPFLPLAFNLKEETKEKILKAGAIAEHAGFQILFFQLDEEKKTHNQAVDQFLRSTERETISQVPQAERQTKLFVFSSKDGGWWHFIHAEQVGSKLRLKRFSIDPDNRNKLRTASEQLDEIKIDPVIDTSLQKVRTKHEEAFRIDLLTKKFYNDYVRVFKNLRQELFGQKGDIDDALKTAHHYTHLLLNRVMFLYFVQKRGCFEGEKDFLHIFWNTYRDNYEGSDKFLDKWLKVLFFTALNQAPGSYVSKVQFKNLPEGCPDFNLILQQSPYLNGGLFEENSKLDFVGYRIKDSFFVEIIDFFESYNFTIQESTPLDQDLSIDPEMLGNIYEMLVNVSDQDDERHKAGIFYTPKVEIELMIRRSLVEYFSNKTEIEKKKLYQFLFQEDEPRAMPDFSRSERDALLKELDDIRLVDPACGSGHYLVVASQIFYELKEQLYQQKGITPDKFAEKKKIIEHSIFGMDVKEWATEVAKLRLWLDLFVDASQDKFQSREPLLPRLSFKIRVGDSLVQELGGVYFSPGAVHGLSPSLRSLLNQLKDLKRRFYNNDPHVAENQVRGREIGFYQAVLGEKIRENQRQVAILERPALEMFQQRLLKVQSGQDDFEQTKRAIHNQEVDSLRGEIASLQQQQQQLGMDRKFAFWPIEFAEVFAEKKGFDIVIANPPYVRQEIIADPNQEKPTIEQRREYKEKLSTQLKTDWGNPKGDLLKIPKRSDLYVYFYLKGLKLLNPSGVFCYVSSNSWLDVGYGAKLQEILLRRVPIIAIYDNQAKRSFKHADVNTVIVVLGAPQDSDWKDKLQDNIARFVMFKKPFEEVLSAESFVEIENIKERQENEHFKVFPISQIELWKAGAEAPEEKFEKLPEAWEYGGNKWGGKYLRAPEIYWTILEKAGDKLVRLGDIAEVRRGFTTGANEFFYVQDVTDELED